MLSIRFSTTPAKPFRANVPGRTHHRYSRNGTLRYLLRCSSSRVPPPTFWCLFYQYWVSSPRAAESLPCTRCWVYWILHSQPRRPEFQYFGVILQTQPNRKLRSVSIRVLSITVITLEFHSVFLIVALHVIWFLALHQFQYFQISKTE